MQSSTYIKDTAAGVLAGFIGGRDGGRRFARAAHRRSFAARTADIFSFRKRRITAVASLPFIEPRTAAMSPA
jgi:hypothetical protein